MLTKSFWAENTVTIRRTSERKPTTPLFAKTHITLILTKNTLATESIAELQGGIAGADHQTPMMGFIRIPRGEKELKKYVIKGRGRRIDRPPLTQRGSTPSSKEKCRDGVRVVSRWHRSKPVCPCVVKSNVDVGTIRSNNRFFRFLVVRGYLKNANVSSCQKKNKACVSCDARPPKLFR